MSMIRFRSVMSAAALVTTALMIGCGEAERNRGEGDAGRAANDTAPAASESAGGTAATRGVSGAEAHADGVVLFIGTSLTAGLGLSPEQAFPRLIERKIDDAGLPFRVVNAGVSGETSAGALSRIDWLLRQPFDIVVLETGANDMLRGTAPAATERNIQAIIDRIRTERPETRIILAGMRAMPNLGRQYAREFEPIYPRLAERNGLTFIPFLLDGVAGVRDLNQADGVHPTAAGDSIVAVTVWDVLEPVLRDAAGG